MFRRVRIFPALAALLALVCAGCASAPGSSTSTSPAASSASTELSGPKAIEHVDFAHLTWYDAQSGSTLGGSGASPSSTSGGSWWRVDAASNGNPTQFSDLNGDGYEDAIVWITVGKGTDYWHYAYIWLWNPATHTAEQLKDPITDDKNCGNSTKSLTVSGPRITVTRLIRQGESCSQQPSHEVTNTIILEKGVPIRTSPIRASVMPCLAPSSDAASPSTLKNALRLLPSTSAPEVGLNQMSFIVLGGARGTLTNGFQQVLYHAAGDSITWYCAYTDEIK